MNGGKPVLTPNGSRHAKMHLSVLWLSICLVSLLSISCRDTEKPVAEPVAGTPGQKLDRFSTQHTEAGTLKWTLVGEAAASFQQDFVEVDNPTVEIFEDGNVSIKLTSKKGIHFLRGTEKDNLHLSGNVVGMSNDGELYTEELHWLNRTGLLYAPNQATVVRGDSTWTGVKMQANPTLETVKMEKNQFKIYTKDEKIDELQ